MKFSIVIPTWEQYGNGFIFLNDLLNSIKKQTLTDYEIIISDHSKDTQIKNLLDNFKDLSIVYLKNNENYGNSPANLNKGLKLATGKIIKTMFQDDFFIDENSLKLIYDYFENNSCKWLVNGCCHTTDGKNFDRYMIPKWNDNILFGNNTISSPSVLSFINEDIILFDENLTMLMDCDYYFSLKLKYGLPCILNNHLVVNRIHKHQISRMYNKDINNEINYVKQKNKNFI